MALIDHIVETHNVDPDHIILGGHSSGGFFTYDWELTQQKRFAALIPASAFATRRIPRPDRKQAPPIHHYHSKNDKVIIWNKMIASTKKLEKAGYSVALTEDDQHHNIGPKFIQLLEQVFTQINNE